MLLSGKILMQHPNGQNLEFLGPTSLDSVMPRFGGIYVVLHTVLVGLGLSTEKRVIYIGQTENFAERGFVTSHHAYERWVMTAGRKNLSIAILPLASQHERAKLEETLIKHYSPSCNRIHNLTSLMGGNYGLRGSNGKISR